jgi:NADPH-dependent curcumin reductase CurA
MTLLKTGSGGVPCNRFGNEELKMSKSNGWETWREEETEQGSNELLLKNLYLSCDPYMRIMMTKDTTSGIGALIPGSVCHAIPFINYYYNFFFWF